MSLSWFSVFQHNSETPTGGISTKLSTYITYYLGKNTMGGKALKFEP